MRTTARAIVLLVLALAGGCASAPAFDEPARAVWLTRFDVKTRDGVERAIERCAGAGFNHVMFQVRGHGVAHWRSRIEPWADELGGADPGFDPLAVACAAAHARGLKLHAWVNVMPSWRGDAPPSNPRQLWNARPEWHWFDARGNRQALQKNFYVSLNPCLPEVRDYLVAVCREIVTAAPVDGLHLDYVRFVDELERDADAFPQDARTLALYREHSGKAPHEDVRAWRRWKADRVTELVASIRTMLDDAAPHVLLSAAVGSGPEGPQDAHQRDSARWVRDGLLDAVFPMNYTADVAQFRTRASAWARVADAAGVPLVMGIQIDPARPIEVIDTQLALARRETPHFCLFAYAHLFAAATSLDARAEATRKARHDVLVPRLRAMAGLGEPDP